jgi:hypothetical protein
MNNATFDGKQSRSPLMRSRITFAFEVSASM